MIKECNATSPIKGNNIVVTVASEGLKRLSRSSSLRTLLSPGKKILNISKKKGSPKAESINLEDTENAHPNSPISPQIKVFQITLFTF